MIDHKVSEVATEESASSPEVARLIATFGKGTISDRKAARERLQQIGQPATAALTRALTDASLFVRWEAAKVLGELRDPVAAPALVRALEDEQLDIRWLAAEALIALEGAGLPHLLTALSDWRNATWLRDGAHHILNALIDRGWGQLLKPVLNALESADPQISVPAAATSALRTLQAEPIRMSTAEPIRMSTPAT